MSPTKKNKHALLVQFSMHYFTNFINYNEMPKYFFIWPILEARVEILQKI